eukprot:scaffold90303_cov19-Tisochrysis_lutea.AAC.4
MRRAHMHFTGKTHALLVPSGARVICAQASGALEGGPPLPLPRRQFTPKPLRHVRFIVPHYVMRDPGGDMIGLGGIAVHALEGSWAIASGTHNKLSLWTRGANTQLQIRCCHHNVSNHNVCDTSIVQALAGHDVPGTWHLWAAGRSWGRGIHQKQSSWNECLKMPGAQTSSCQQKMGLSSRCVYVCTLCAHVHGFAGVSSHSNNNGAR